MTRIVFALTVFLSLSANARPDGRTVSEHVYNVILPVNASTLTCLHDVPGHMDIIRLQVAPQPGIPALAKGLVLIDARDLWFDPGCDQSDLMAKAQSIGGILKTQLRDSVSEYWAGGYGTPCERMRNRSVVVMTMPVFYNSASYSRAWVFQREPDSVCKD